MLSILHISDLHRSKEWKVNNAALLASLQQDKDSYTKKEDPLIMQPNLIIVSGDIINGSINPDFDQALNEIKKQYEEANDFLQNLTDKFLDGDKSRIAIVPGNHDVNFAYSKMSMKKIPATKDYEKDELAKRIFSKNSRIRWSWKEQTFYEIDNLDHYKMRFELFSQFYNDFYNSKHLFSLDPQNQFDVFDVEELNTTVFTFNSCFYNDHLNFAGAICPDSIANAYPQIIDFKNKGRLLIAVWHHNVKGSPYEFNYMSNSIVKNFIDYGFQLGFHGHQHESEIIEEILKFTSKENIFIISSGTLCGGPPQLPTGANRQYNIIEIDSDMKVNLHSRQMMQNINFELPIWQQGRIQNSLNSYTSFELKERAPSKLIKYNLIIDLIGNKKYTEAIDILIELDLTDSFVRASLLQCYVELEYHQKIIDSFFPPKNSSEIVFLLNSCHKQREYKKLQLLIEIIESTYSNDTVLKELKLKYSKISAYGKN